MKKEITKISGEVLAYKPISSSRVQIECCDLNIVIELRTMHSWVINRGDQITVSGYYDETGMFIAIAYFNKSKNTKGWNERRNISNPTKNGGLFFMTIGFLLCLTGVGAIVGIPMLLFGYSFISSGNKDMERDLQDELMFKEARDLIGI